MTAMTSRHQFLFCFILCVAAMCVALFFQIVLHESPCPLCIIQRVFVIAMGIFFLIAYIHHPKSLGIRLYSLLELILGSGGMTVAGRQVWLQLLPKDQVPACGPGLDTLFKMLPLQKVIALLFQGSGECARVYTHFLGLSLAGWTCLFFLFLMLICLWQLIFPKV